VTISFRTRLFAIAALIVAAVLAAVMILGWTRVLDFEVERLDDRLCMEARRLATQPLEADDMPRLEADMLGKLRLNSIDQLMLRFDSTEGAAASKSSRWSDGLEIAALNWARSARQDEPPPPKARPEKGSSGKAERPEPEERGPRGACSLASFAAGSTQWRAAVFAAPGGRGFVAADLAAPKAELQGAVRGALTLVIPLALVLTALGAWLLSSLTMRPVDRLRDAMKAVTQKALDQRLPGRGEDREFRELIGAYNTMLDRLEASFRQASRFSADAAHELKTPLTILQGRIEQAVRKSNNRAVQSDLTGMLDEVGRLAAITRKLLLLSQADAGRLALNVARLDLSELLDGLMSDAQMLVGEQKVSSAIEPHLAVDGDAVLLRQLLNNLISNAVSYGRPEGWIRVEGRRLAAGIEVLIANFSDTISLEDRARFFDRFYRGDPAHNRQIEGNGLGLSLAREIARAHGGDLTLEPSALDEVRLRLWLPL
jgi:two-component system heavy metal sensor histidine kinase CusS